MTGLSIWTTLLTTTPPFNSAPGANFDVNAMVAQPDGKIVVGGDFE